MEFGRNQILVGHACKSNSKRKHEQTHRLCIDDLPGTIGTALCLMLTQLNSHKMKKRYNANRNISLGSIFLTAVTSPGPN